MENALAEPQTLLVLGGTSDIGAAIAEALISPSCRRIVLACRQPGDAEPIRERLSRPGIDVTAVAFDAARHELHTAFVNDVVDDVGDLDVVVLAFGVLGSQTTFDRDPAAAARAVDTNYTGTVSVGLAVAEQLRRQGHGTLVVLSSVAGERVRADNFVYGSSKAGQDGFAQGLGHALVGSGASVLIVRPGFVHSKMTAGRRAAPLSTTPARVAESVVAALRARRRVVWSPGALRWVMLIIRHLPTPIFRRLPFG